MRGILTSESEIGTLAGTTYDGTDESQLERAARHYGCELPTIRVLDPNVARNKLTGFLRDGIPCLLCVNEWDHWVTAVNEEKGQFIILDSETPDVVVAVDWPRLRQTWVYHDEDEADGQTTHMLYDLHPLLPKDRVPTRARFSLERAHQLRQPENRGLARLWDVYVEDLVVLCRAHEPRSGRAISFGEYLRRHAEMFVDELATWHGKIERDSAEEVLERMRFVADTYGLVIRQGDEKRTISAISTILALWAAGEYGIEPLYRKVPVRKIR